MLALAVAAATAASRQPVIIVADVGVDDAAGLVLALSSPKLEVLGIAATFGSSRKVERCAHNAERLLAAANRSDVPVYIGSRYPFGGWARPEADGGRVHGADGFGDLPGAEAECSAKERAMSAAEFIATSARQRPGEIALLSFSPLTNVALALAIEPSLPSLLHSFVAMGGAIYAPGNASPLAEANFLHDAAAARAVVHAFSQDGGCEFVLFPLDLTNAVVTTAAEIEAMRAGGHAAAMFADAWAVYQEGYCRLGGVCDGTPLHDAHVVAFVIAPEIYTRAETLHVQVHVSSRHDDPPNGMSIVDRRGERRFGGGVKVVLEADGRAFTELLVRTIGRTAARQP